MRLLYVKIKNCIYNKIRFCCCSFAFWFYLLFNFGGKSRRKCHYLDWGQWATTGYISWFKNMVDSVPVLLGCKQVKISGETQTCYFYNESERITMTSHGKKTSLTISAVNVSDTGLYYCSFIQQAKIKFCKSVYLQVKGKFINKIFALKC